MSVLINKVLLASWLVLVNARLLSGHSASNSFAHNSIVNTKGPSYEYYKLPSATELSSVELELMKNILANAVRDYNRRISKRFSDMRIVQPNYGVQYKVTLSQNGDKLVEINAFAKERGNDSHYRNLNSEEVIVFDGGSSFFNTTINLKTKKASLIRIHGFA